MKKTGLPMRGSTRNVMHELRRSYHRAHEAASNMLRDGNRLEAAQRRSGEKESVYEKQQLRNEMFAERSRDTAQAHQERARDAVEDIYEHAQDALRAQPGSSVTQLTVHAGRQWRALWPVLL